MYQQARNFTWRVQETAKRIAGQVTSKYGKVEQCDCEVREIEEIDAPFLTLLDRLIMQGWQMCFPYHHWIAYLDYLVGGLSIDRKPRWFDAALVKEKVLPLLDATDLEDARNVVKGTMRYCWNEQRGCGSIYPHGLSGGLSMRPIARTRARTAG